MHKILLVIDDYSELEALESLLKRFGFDVLALGKEVLVPDALLRFQPELVIATYKGRSIDGFRVASRLKVPRPGSPAPRIALIWSGGSPTLGDDVSAVIDALVEEPLEAFAVIQLVSRLLNVSEDSLIKKYERLGLAPLSTSQSGARPGHESTSLSSERDARYAAFLRDHDESVKNTLPREIIRAESRKLIQNESQTEKDANEKILKEKREFAEKLLRSGGEVTKAARGKK